MRATAAAAAGRCAGRSRCSARRHRTPTPRSRALDAAFPATEQFARDLADGLAAAPGRRSRPPTRGWRRRSRCCPGPSSAGCCDELAPATGDLAAADARTSCSSCRRSTRSTAASPTCSCRPATSSSRTGRCPAGVPNYQEFWYAMAGQAAEGQGADGNGNFLRIGGRAAGRTRSRRARPTTTATIDTGFAQMPTCRRCARGRHIPTACPPLQRTVPCYTQPVPERQRPGLDRPGRRLAPERPAAAAAQRPDGADPVKHREPTSAGHAELRRQARTIVLMVAGGRVRPRRSAPTWSPTSGSSGRAGCRSSASTSFCAQRARCRPCRACSRARARR